VKICELVRNLGVQRGEVLLPVLDVSSNALTVDPCWTSVDAASVSVLC
jgi:hypothetical protein